MEYSEIQQIQNEAFRAVEFIQKYLPDMQNKHKMVKLTPPQVDAIDTIQFGFPLRNYDFKEVKKVPRGAVMVWPRQTGKSTACAYAGCAFLFIIPNCSVGIIAADEKTAKKLFKKIKKVLQNSLLWKYVDKSTVRVDYLELVNGNCVEVWPCTENIQGSTYTYLFCDEAAKIDEEILFTNALPTVTHGERWIMLSTPKGPKGKFIDYYFRGLETRPIICTGCGQEYPQGYFDVDIFPPGEMPQEHMIPCPLCNTKDYKYGVGVFAVPYVDPWNDGIRDPELVRRMLDDDGWTVWGKQEYLGQIISDAAMVFPGEWLKNCTNPKLKNIFKNDERNDYILGVDYGRKHDASCFYVTHRNMKTGKIVLDYAQTVAGEKERDDKKTYKYIRKVLMTIVAKFRPVWLVPDATGMGDPLVEQLIDDIQKLSEKGRLVIEEGGKKHLIRVKAHTVSTQVFSNRAEKGFILSMKTKPELIGNLIKLFQSNSIEIPSPTEPEIGKMREELLRFECETNSGTNYIKYGTQSFHDDRVIAFALSCWAHRHPPSIIDRISMIPFKFEYFDDEDEEERYY